MIPHRGCRGPGTEPSCFLALHQLFVGNHGLLEEAGVLGHEGNIQPPSRKTHESSCCEAMVLTTAKKPFKISLEDVTITPPSLPV